MKAVVFEGNQKPIELIEIPTPQPGKGEVLIKLSYAALNHLDLIVIKEVQVVPNGRVILGSDGAGVVVSVGEGVTEFVPGQEVIINPALRWGGDIKAPSDEFEILGFPDNGTFAENIVIDRSQVYPKPAHLSLKEAAALPLVALTAYRSLFTRGGLQKGQSMLITGIGGGLAQFLLQLALSVDAKVYVTSGDEAKLASAVRNGAEAGFNYKKESWVSDAKQTLPGGFDLIVDSAGGEGFLSLIELIKTGGTIVVLGRTAGAIPSINPRLLFNKQINIHGSVMGSPKEFEQMLNHYQRYKLHPVIDKTYKLHQVKEALAELEKGKHTGKIVLEIQ